MKRHTQAPVIGMLFFGSILAASLSAQTVAPPTAATQTTPPAAQMTPTTVTTVTSAPGEEEIVKLSPFEVSTTRNVGYQATDTLAGTRIRTNLADVGSSIQVITKEFLVDIGATGNDSLLQYTTNAEVAGTRGTYAGLGNGTSVEDTGNLRAPESAQRVRGLAAADNTRDFFVTDIPWDSYNVDRIDIQRGPNQILFGLGSPAGIVNATMHNAEFHDYGSVEARTGSYGTFRSSIDLNQELVQNVLAIRVDSMWDDHQYEQTQAWQNDKRFSGAIRFDPQLFNRRDFHTSIKVKVENGNIKADRPRIVPPVDQITPWFRPIDTTSLNGGMGKLAVPNGYTIGSAAPTFSPWLGGYANQQQPIWFMDGLSNQLYRIYGGYVNTGALNAAGVPQGAGVNLVGMRYADAFSDLTNLSTYANNAHLPNYQYGQYRNESLLDPSVFDFYHNLIDGPTASQFEKWNALNFDLQQTFWDDRLGVQLTDDRQKYKRGGQNLIGGPNSNNPAINIDVLQNFQDYVVGPTNATNGNVANPNFGRPFVAAGPGGGNSYKSDRKYVRGSLFGEIRTTDFFGPDSFLAKLLGRHRFNGAYSDEHYSTENLRWQMYANSLAYATYKLQGNPDGIQNLPPIAVIYLGGSMANATSAANAHLPGIPTNLTLQSGNIYQFDSTWRNPTGVNFADPWNVPTNLQAIFNGAPVINTTTGLPYAQLTQVSNPANYVGWNSNFTDNLLRYDNGADQSLLTAASLTLRETKSYAGTWQGYLWNEAIVPTLGWRYDEVKGQGVTAQTLSGATARGALNLDPTGPASAQPYVLPGDYGAGTLNANQTRSDFKAHSTAGGVVVHLNKLLGGHDFLPINISLSSNKSSNFQVTDARRDIYGNNIANPTGATKEYGLLLSTKDGRYSLRVMKYDTKLVGATLSGFDNSGIYGTIRDALNWRNIKTYYMSAYAWSTAGQTNTAHYSGNRYMWDAVWVDNTTGRPVASGALTTGPANSHLETQAQADTRRDAAIAAINNMQIWLANNGYFNAWNYGVGPTTQTALETPGQYLTNPILPNPASVYDYRTAPLLQGFAVTADTRSKGYEYEFTANPTPNWRITINAAETTAVRTNVGGATLDQLVSYMDTLMAGPAGDLIRFNSDYSAGNELRMDWSGWRGQYTLLKLGEGADAPELRKWRYNVITDYQFTSGFLNGSLKGVGVGAAYRWQDKVVIGYPVIPGTGALANFDLSKPYYGPSEDALDLWLSYERKITSRIDWRIQLNVYNVGKRDRLIPISVEPDGHTWASVRIAPVQEWALTNTFSF
ncbi:MAG: TonB-dependent receptor plug domain-containing protein [Opitutaceae bacterium]